MLCVYQHNSKRSISGFSKVTVTVTIFKDKEKQKSSIHQFTTTCKMILYSYNFLFRDNKKKPKGMKSLIYLYLVRPPQTSHGVFGNKNPGECYARIPWFDLFVHRLGSSWSSSKRAALESCLLLDSLDCLKACVVKCQGAVTNLFAQLSGQQQWGFKGRNMSFWPKNECNSTRISPILWYLGVAGSPIENKMIL